MTPSVHAAGWSFAPTALLGSTPTGTGTIALDPTFRSFTLLEPVSHEMNWFLW
jgi:hypothetical protein